MEPSIPIHTLIKLVYAEDITKEKIRTLDLTLANNNVKSKLEYQSSSGETCDENLEVMFTQTMIRMKRLSLIFANTVIIVTNLITLFQINFANLAKMEKGGGILYLDRNHM